jgi:hypothetical protein
MSLAGSELMPPKKKTRAKSSGQMGRPKAVDPALPIASFRGKAKFKQWFEGFAKLCRVDNSTLLEHSLVEYAKVRGYEPPPER